MTTVDQSGRVEERDLAYLRAKVQKVLRAWDSRTPNQLLAANIVLSISLGAPGKSLIGSLPFGNKVQVTGREEAKRVLGDIYADLRSGLSVTTELVSGYDVLLLGELILPSPDEDRLSMPIVVYMVFDDDGKVEKMTIAGAHSDHLIKVVRTELRKLLPLGGPE